MRECVHAACAPVKKEPLHNLFARVQFCFFDQCQFSVLGHHCPVILFAQRLLVTFSLLLLKIGSRFCLQRVVVEAVLRMRCLPGELAATDGWGFDVCHMADVAR